MVRYYGKPKFPDGKNDDRWYHWCVENWDTKWDDMHESNTKTTKF